MRRRFAVAVLLASGIALAVWANLPPEDPWRGVLHGEPHPRIGGVIKLAAEQNHWIALPPLALQPRHAELPSHWRTSLQGLPVTTALADLPAPDHEHQHGHLQHRWWWSWCPIAEGSPWIAHLWLICQDDRIIAVRVVGGGGREQLPESP